MIDVYTYVETLDPNGFRESLYSKYACVYSAIV